MADAPEDVAPIQLHADGSFSREVGLGAWAYLVPELKLDGIGSGPGRTATRFEFLAVVHGLEAIVASDSSSRPIHVYSDCDTTVCAIERTAAGLPLKKPERYHDRADLLPRLEAVAAQRQLRVTKFGNGKLEHQACHQNALLRLRQEVDGDPRVRYRVLLARHQSRLAQLIGDRRATIERLEKIEDEISMLHLQIEAVESAMRAVSIRPESGPGDGVPNPTDCCERDSGVALA
jgi:ribonuclease HI